MSQVYWNCFQDGSEEEDSNFLEDAEADTPLPPLIIPQDDAEAETKSVASPSQGSSAYWLGGPTEADVLGVDAEDGLVDEDEYEVEKAPATQIQHPPSPTPLPASDIFGPLPVRTASSTTLLETSQGSVNSPATPRPRVPAVEPGPLKRSRASEVAEQATAKRPRVDNGPNPFLDPSTSARGSRSLGSVPMPRPRYYEIVHNRHWQQYLDKRNVSWGAQWELGRLISRGLLHWGDLHVAEDLDAFAGTNHQAGPNVQKYLRKRANRIAVDSTFIPDDLFEKYYKMESQTLAPWQELDAEDELLAQGSSKRLGEGSETSWNYSGKVNQVISLVLTDKSCDKRRPLADQVRMVMEAQEQGKSTRVSRFYGSRRLLQVSIHQRLLGHPGLAEFFLQRFVLFGRVFRAFTCKEKNVYLIETNEDYQRLASGPIDNGRMSLEDFLNWHNPLKTNGHQMMAKWAARFHLALSTSVPSVRFERGNIRQEPDMIGHWDNFDPDKKIPSEKIMTDGCGILSPAVLEHLKRQFGLDRIPCAVQARLGGTKGMFVTSGYDAIEDHEALLAYWRPSQLKITWPVEPEASQLTLDVVKIAKASTPARISTETLINLTENGVPHEVFQGLMGKSIKDCVEQFTAWEGANSMEILWLTVCDASHVIGERLRREAFASSRAKGFGEKDNQDEPDGEWDDEEAAQTDKAARWWPDPISGLPASLQETVMEFLSSGFQPQSNPVLYEKLNEVVKTEIKKVVRKFRLTVNASLTAIIVPDHRELLQEGEIFFRSSKPLLEPVTGHETDVLTGDVLVGRHPTKLATDVRKVRAVDIPELHYIKDVVVFSTIGERSLASILAGGDYDGDMVSLIWEPAIVEPFRNADLSLAEPPPELEDEFEQETESVDSFLQRTNHLSQDEKTREIQRVLLRGLTDVAIVGKYSFYHEASIYRYGYNHPKTRRLAHMFCQQLDGAKSGKRIKREVRGRDEQEWEVYEKVPWRSLMDDRPKGDGKNLRTLHRNKDLKSFIMDGLIAVGKRAWAEYETLYHSKRPRTWPIDQALTAPWEDAEKRAVALEQKKSAVAAAMREELEWIKEHVVYVRKEHQTALNGTGPLSPMKPQPGGTWSDRKGSGFTKLAIQKRQGTYRKLSALFISNKKGDDPEREYEFFSAEEVLRLKASFAYKQVPNQRFPYDVAFRTLCEIKAKSLGPTKTTTDQFHRKAFLKPLLVKPH